MSKHIRIIGLILCFLVMSILNVNEYVYAEDYNDVYVKLISSERHENADQEGLTVEDVLIRVTGATFKEDINYTNYDKAFEVLDCPPGYSIAMEAGGVKRVSPQVLKVRIRGGFPLLQDAYFNIKFKDTAFNENERDIYLREDGVVKIELSKGPNVEFTNNIITENEIRNGFSESGFYDFPIIKTDVGTFRKDVSVDDINVIGVPAGYEYYVKYKSDTELYFTIIPKYSQWIVPLDKDYTCDVSIDKSAYEEDVKIPPSSIELKLEQSNTNLDDKLKITMDLDEKALIEYELTDDKDNVIMSGLKGCKEGENILLIDGDMLSTQSYYMVLKNKPNAQTDEQINADITIKHNNEASKTWNVILPNSVENDENIKWQLDTAVFKINKITNSKYDIELSNQDNVSIDLSSYEEKSINGGKIQPIDKKFNITFNHELSVDENLYKSIKVIEEDNGIQKRVPVLIEYNIQNLKCLHIHPPKDGWEKGKTYYIVIEPNIKSIQDKNLEKGVKATFEVK